MATQTRADIPENQKWDLSKLFNNSEEYKAAVAEFEGLLGQVADYKGTLAGGAAAVKAAIDFQETLERKLMRVYIYSHLFSDLDTSDNFGIEQHAIATSLYVKFTEAYSWFEPELLSLDSIPEVPEYQRMLDRIAASKEHTLDAAGEEILSTLGEVFETASNAFSTLTNSDFEFGTLTTEDGEEVEITHGNYGKYLESNNRDVRKSIFEKYFKTYTHFGNTLASTFDSMVKASNARAKIRGYKTSREMYLSGNEVPESVYDTLVEAVNKNLPLLHRYVALRKRLLGLEELHTYDMYVAPVEELELTFTYDEACEIMYKALAPLGEDYIAVVKEAVNSRWIDVHPTKGKRSGAYSSGSYDSAPYILLNWQDNLDNLYTLVHEVGHSLHSYLTAKNQPYTTGSYPIFLAEIASTTNENLLTEYLLKTLTSPKERIFILSQYLDGFKGTVFRQTQFAEFEHYVRIAAQEGQPLTNEYVSEYYADLNARYYGEALERDEQIASEWSRIPHFYSPYYVFQYSTGFAAANALAARMLDLGQPAVDDYLGFLKSGNSKKPVDTMKAAGVDMTTVDYIDNAFKVFEERLVELEKLV
ncbi:MAG: oligoendopeptidase F [Lactobacillales bacterium]|jgi:oligoendopeptidase F|nr:oligoendopeptidase F [Lactobacillales bacterium]